MKPTPRFKMIAAGEKVSDVDDFCRRQEEWRQRYASPGPLPGVRPRGGASAIRGRDLVNPIGAPGFQAASSRRLTNELKAQFARALLNVTGRFKRRTVD
jgi:hypothetical protein